MDDTARVADTDMGDGTNVGVGSTGAGVGGNGVVVASVGVDVGGIGEATGGAAVGVGDNKVAAIDDTVSVGVDGVAGAANNMCAARNISPPIERYAPHLVVRRLRSMVIFTTFRIPEPANIKNIPKINSRIPKKSNGLSYFGSQSILPPVPIVKD